jgi:hypothetical protein
MYVSDTDNYCVLPHIQELPLDNDMEKGSHQDGPSVHQRTHRLQVLWLPGPNQMLRNCSTLL